VCRALNAAIAALRRDGTIGRLQRRWLSVELARVRVPGLRAARARPAHEGQSVASVNGTVCVPVK